MSSTITDAELQHMAGLPHFPLSFSKIPCEMAAELLALRARIKELEAALKQSRSYHHGECQEFKGEGRCNCFVVSVGERDAEKYDTKVREQATRIGELETVIQEVVEGDEEAMAELRKLGIYYDESLTLTNKLKAAIGNKAAPRKEDECPPQS